MGSRVRRMLHSAQNMLQWQLQDCQCQHQKTRNQTFHIASLYVVQLLIYRLSSQLIINHWFNKCPMLTLACIKENFLSSIWSESTLVKTPCTVLCSGVPGLIRPEGVGGRLLEEACVADTADTVKGSHHANTMSTIFSPVVCKVLVIGVPSLTENWSKSLFSNVVISCHQHPTSTTDTQILFLFSISFLIMPSILHIFFSSCTLINIFWKLIFKSIV